MICNVFKHSLKSQILLAQSLKNCLNVLHVADCPSAHWQRHHFSVSRKILEASKSKYGCGCRKFLAHAHSYRSYTSQAMSSRESLWITWSREELIGFPHTNSLYPGVSGGLAFCATTVHCVTSLYQLLQRRQAGLSCLTACPTASPKTRSKILCDLHIIFR